MKICILIFLAGFILIACHPEKRLTERREAFVVSYPLETTVREEARDTLVIEEEAKPQPARVEKIVLTEGNEIRQYCIIMGSFVEEINAVRLRNDLIRMGFLGSCIMRNSEGMYRVSSICLDSHEDAWEELTLIRRQYPAFRDAWLLETGINN